MVRWGPILISGGEVHVDNFKVGGAEFTDMLVWYDGSGIN